MNKQLIKELIADAATDKVGLRIRAVVDTVVSIACYAYTAGLMAGDKWMAFVEWYESKWIGNVEASETYPEETTAAPNTIEGVITPKEYLQPTQTIVDELSETILKPKKQRRKAVGFAN